MQTSQPSLFCLLIAGAPSLLSAAAQKRGQRGAGLGVSRLLR